MCNGFDQLFRVIFLATRCTRPFISLVLQRRASCRDSSIDLLHRGRCRSDDDDFVGNELDFAVVGFFCVFGSLGFCLILVLSTGLDEWNDDDEFADELLDVSNKFVAVKFTSILVKLLILFLCFRISAGKEIG